MECVECKSDRMVQISMVGSKQNYRCDDCGAERFILVTLAPCNEDGSLRTAGLCFHLTGRWIAKPELKQVARVSQLFPHLQVQGFSALWRRAVANEVIEFGIFTQEGVDYVAGELRKCGIQTAQALDELSLPLSHT
jgi:hypothetical protein